MFGNGEKITVGKLEAARRQLRTAIELWFHDGDVVSMHTLAFAAYEIIHVVSKKRNRARDLIFDSLIVKDEYRSEWNKTIKKEANFFKHANNDADASIEFLIAAPAFFMLFAILGVQLAGESLNDAENAFMQWLYFNCPDLLTDEGRKQFQDDIDPKRLSDVRSLSKREFFEAFLSARASRRAGSYVLSTRLP